MFTKARIKLTAWYLLIIMFVSISFSGFIYRSVDSEFQRRLSAIETRLELRRLGFQPPLGRDILFIEDILEARRRVGFLLIYTNFVILIFSAVAGYFLAGKTLEPIEKLLEDQKRFIADAGHELKTPITAMTTSIEVALRDKKLNLNSAKQILQENLRDIAGLGKLVNNLLVLSKFQNNTSLKSDFDVRETVQRIVVKLKPIANKKKIKVTLDAEKIMIKGNKEDIEKLVTVLLDNAIKFSQEGDFVEVRVKKSGKYLLLAVKDTGMGISPKDLPHIFDRFYQAESSHNKNEDNWGYGLGLSMAKSIVEAHNGSIHAESKLGKGSIFTIKIPFGK